MRFQLWLTYNGERSAARAALLAETPYTDVAERCAIALLERYAGRTTVDHETGTGVEVWDTEESRRVAHWRYKPAETLKPTDELRG